MGTNASTARNSSGSTTSAYHSKNEYNSAIANEQFIGRESAASSSSSSTATGTTKQVKESKFSSRSRGASAAKNAPSAPPAAAAAAPTTTFGADATSRINNAQQQSLQSQQAKKAFPVAVHKKSNNAALVQQQQQAPPAASNDENGMVAAAAPVQASKNQSFKSTTTVAPKQTNVAPIQSLRQAVAAAPIQPIVEKILISSPTESAVPSPITSETAALIDVSLSSSSSNGGQMMMSENIHVDSSSSSSSNTTSTTVEQEAAVSSSVIPSGVTTDDIVHREFEKMSIAESVAHSEGIDVKDTIAPASSASSPASIIASSASADTHPLSPPSFTSSEFQPTPRRDFPRRNDIARSMPYCNYLPNEQQTIRSHLVEKEKEYMVNPLYMNLQPELNYKMREILLDWLAGVSGRFRLKPEAYMLATNLLDRFLSKRECSRDKFQLVGISCLILAAKYEEILPPSIEDFLIVTDHAFQKKQILHMEGVILENVGYKLTIPYVSSFTGPLMVLLPIKTEKELEEEGVKKQLLGYDTQTGAPIYRNYETELRHLVMYYTLASFQHAQFLYYTPSLIAASAVVLAYWQIQSEMDGDSSSASSQELYWDADLKEASGGYDLIDMIDCITDFIDCLNAMSESAAPIQPNRFTVGNSVQPQQQANPVTQTKYNSITKRYQRSIGGEVANRVMRVPNWTKVVKEAAERVNQQQVQEQQ